MKLVSGAQPAQRPVVVGLDSMGPVDGAARAQRFETGSLSLTLLRPLAPLSRVFPAQAAGRERGGLA